MSASVTAEKPTVISPRVYKRHRAIIKKSKKKFRVSDAEIVRRALDEFGQRHLS